MAGNWRKAVTSVTDMMFPVKKTADDIQKEHLVKAGNEYVSNLPLQMSLYFNLFFYPLWLISTIVCLQAKYESLSTLYRIVIIAILIVISVVEVIRLYIGYIGNLQEQVPELAGSWLLSMLISLPLLLFLLFNEALIILPLERAVHIVMAGFLLFEVLCGYFAIRMMINHQVKRFHLQQFTDLQRVPDPSFPPQYIPGLTGYVNPTYKVD